jgi:hypothetical protein
MCIVINWIGMVWHLASGTCHLASVICHCSKPEMFTRTTSTRRNRSNKFDRIVERRAQLKGIDEWKNEFGLNADGGKRGGSRGMISSMCDRQCLISLESVAETVFVVLFRVGFDF